ncbi:MAG TPA: cation-translocating P-type ATPase [Candidatus Bathyarchaeia archaeon]|nr:cation-translocating P-type ATPase [Candidatus Bathyarchaeia archaeon]
MISDDFHTYSIGKLLKSSQSSKAGLTQTEAEQRLINYGPNSYEEGKKISAWQILLAQFKDFLILILIVATVLSFFIGETLDAIVILSIVLACTILGFIQEYQSEKSLEALKKLATPQANALRNKEEVEIKSEDIVPGDILILRAGDKIAADARLIEELNLKVDESLLTGESVPLDKSSGIICRPGTALADRKNMIYAGTVITYGHGKALVVATGGKTEFGKIASGLAEIVPPKTNFENKLEKIGKTLGISSLIVCAAAAFLGFLRGYQPLEMIIWGVSLAVAAVPEALPAVVTSSLAIGVKRMAKRNVIIRKLKAVETLGSVTTICCDKTGTLTKNEMTTKEIWWQNKLIFVKGEGYLPKGEFYLRKKLLKISRGFQFFLKIGALCNDAILKEKNDVWRIIGDPTEGALVVAAEKAGIKVEGLRKKFARIGEIQFDELRKRMSTLHSGTKQVLICLKGAPESVIDCCSYYETGKGIKKITASVKRSIVAKTAEMGRRGRRVLAYAHRYIPYSSFLDKKEDLQPEQIETKLIFAGLVGLIDPPRPEVESAVRLAKAAGVRTVIVTGDHALTALAIAQEIGLVGPNEKIEDVLLTGQELEKISDKRFAQIIDKIKIFARTTPHHKLKIIEAYKKNDEIVAMTGDGINDAQAVKKADIGLSMGISGTDVTREASDAILTDDNFATIVDAIKEGRLIFENIRKYLFCLLSCNLAEVMILFSGYLLGLPTILVPVQILWVNLITDGLPAISLGVDPPEGDLMARKPEGINRQIFSKTTFRFLIFLSVFTTLSLLLIFVRFLSTTNLAKAQTMTFVSMIIAELIIAYVSRSSKESLLNKEAFKNRWLNLSVLGSILATYLVIQTTTLQNLFRTISLTASDWTLALGIGLAIALVAEIWKYFIRHSRDTRSIPGNTTLSL